MCITWSSMSVKGRYTHSPMRKKLATVTAHRELTVSSQWPKWSQPAVTEPWPWAWLSCDLAVTEPWSYWRCRDWAVTSPWLSCDLAVTELWPRRDWAVTCPSCDWVVIIGPGAVTTVVTVSSRWAHRELTVTIFFLMGSHSLTHSLTHSQSMDGSLVTPALGLSDITWTMLVGYMDLLYTVKPVCNDHLYHKIYYLWLIQ